MDNILKCECKSEYQDAKYGKGMRVHTPGKKFTCTQCGAQRGEGVKIVVSATGKKK